MVDDMKRRRYIDRVRNENEKEFGPSARESVRASLSANHPYPWIYVYELMQNALDADARRCSWQVIGNAMVFQHDGSQPLNKLHVRAMSSHGGSTKGLDTVGFMGIGFKSVFKRFRKVRVTGFGWRFKFDIGTRQGDLGAEIPEWFDALRPHWDDAPFKPDNGYTTAVRLESPTGRGSPPSDDLDRIASPDNPTPMAMLALRGLEEICIDGVRWRLSVKGDGIIQVDRQNGDNVWLWQSFESRYRPGDDAMRRLLEVRQQLHDRIDAEGRRIERHVVGLLPLDGDKLPDPPDRGTVYATLPTHERLPFGVHLQGDWFVNADRGSLREVSDDPWQESIVRQVPYIVRQFLGWLAKQGEDVQRQAYQVLCDPATDDGHLAKPFQNLRCDMAQAFADLPIVPVLGSKSGGFRTPKQVSRLPRYFIKEFGGNSERRPGILFNLDLVDEVLLGDRGMAFASWLGWGSEIGSEDVRWQETLPVWWDALDKDDRRDALFALWRSVRAHKWNDAPVVPTESGRWRPAHCLRWLDEAPPSENEPGGPEVADALAGFLPTDDERVPDTVRQWVNLSRDDGSEWLKARHKNIKLKELIRSACAAAGKDGEFPAVALARWALNRGERRHDLVPIVMTESGLREPSAALLADPIVDARRGQSRRRLFEGVPALIDDYADIGEPHKIKPFMEQLGVRGKGDLSEKITEYGQKVEVSEALGVRSTDIARSTYGRWDLVDHDFPFKLSDSILDALHNWLRHEYTVLPDKEKLIAKSFWRVKRETKGRKPCTWVRRLQNMNWIPCLDGKYRKPGEVLLDSHPDFDDAAVADMDADLASFLQGIGIEFGSGIPKSPVLRRITKRGATRIPDEELAELLQEAHREVEAGTVAGNNLLDALNSMRIHGAPLTRIVEGIGRGAGLRGALGDWVVALQDMEPRLASAVRAVWKPLPKTITGRQALDFLIDIWRRRPTRTDPVREHLAAAYRYVLEDVGKDEELRETWCEARKGACLYDHRQKWFDVDRDIVVDNVRSPFIRKFLEENKVVVSSGQLGDNDDQIRRAAEALNVNLLSREIDVQPGREVTGPHWVPNLQYLTRVLSSIEGRQALGGIAVHNGLSLQVSGQSHGVSAYVDDSILRIIGNPRDFVQFAQEMAGQLVDFYRLGQRGQEVVLLTGALCNLCDDNGFRSSVEMLATELNVDAPEFPDRNDPPSVHGERNTGQPRQSRSAGDGRTVAPPQANDVRDDSGDTPTRRESREGSNRELSPSGKAPGRDEVRERPRNRPPANGRREAADHVRMVIVTPGDGSTIRRADETSGETVNPGNDRKSRRAVIQYEKKYGRNAEEMPDPELFTGGGGSVGGHGPRR